jgi:hypothetical protein
MIRAANYSAAFCIDFKTNRENQVKFMDVNPRTCTTMTVSAALFASVYVPLAFAIQQQRVRLGLNDEVERRWFINSSFLEIFKTEREVARSGWDPSQGELLRTY